MFSSNCLEASGRFCFPVCMEDRLTKLETLYSDQNKAIEEMSGEMFQQQKEIAGLKDQIEELKERTESFANGIGGNERPPHY